MKLIVNSNIYEVTPQALSKVLTQAEKAAPSGAVYAITRGGITQLIHDTGDGKIYRKNKYRIYRKRAKP